MEKVNIKNMTEVKVEDLEEGVEFKTAMKQRNWHILKKIKELNGKIYKANTNKFFLVLGTGRNMVMKKGEVLIVNK